MTCFKRSPGLRAFAALTACLLVLAAALSRAVATEIVHQQGTATFDNVPERVITFDLASLDTLDALGVEVIGLPKALLPPNLEKYRDDRYENVGSLFEPDFEKVARLAPDLIIVANRSSPAYEMLNQIAPTIDMSVWGEDFLGQFRARVRDLARLFAVEEEAESRIVAIDARITALRERAADAGTALVIMTNGGKLSAYGPGSRFGIIHDEFGFAPAQPGIKTAIHGDPIAFEFIVKMDPEWLFVVDRDSAVGAGAASARATLDNDLVKQTRASRNDRIVYLDTVYWYLVGNGVQAVEIIVDNVAQVVR